MTDHPYTYRPSTSSAERHPWMAHAACVEVGLDAFYPPAKASMAYRQQANMAIAVCRRCPVVKECLDYALAIDDRYGVFGGTTPTQRAKMRRKGSA